MSCGVGCRHSLDPVLLWLWCRLAAAAPIRPLAWAPPYAAGVAQEMAKKKRATDFKGVLWLRLSLNSSAKPRRIELKPKTPAFNSWLNSIQIRWVLLRLGLSVCKVLIVRPALLTLRTILEVK